MEKTFLSPRRLREHGDCRPQKMCGVHGFLADEKWIAWRTDWYLEAALIGGFMVAAALGFGALKSLTFGINIFGVTNWVRTLR